MLKCARLRKDITVDGGAVWRGRGDGGAVWRGRGDTHNQNPLRVLSNSPMRIYLFIMATGHVGNPARAITRDTACHYAPCITQISWDSSFICYQTRRQSRPFVCFIQVFTTPPQIKK